MNPFEAKLGVHVAVLHPPKLSGWLADARDRDRRLQTAAHVMNIVSASDPGTIVAFPAGFLRASSLETADALAEHMLALARQNQVALAFGIQLGDQDDGTWPPIDAPPRTLGFVCDGGRRLLWPTARDDLAHEVRGHRVAVLVGREVFKRELRERAVATRPAVILSLTNLGPTGRWHVALRALGTKVPTIVVGESTTGSMPAWADPPNGWRCERLSSNDVLSVVRYEPLASPLVLQPALIRDVGGQRASVEN